MFLHKGQMISHDPLLSDPIKTTKKINVNKKSIVKMKIGEIFISTVKSTFEKSLCKKLRR